MIANKIEAGMKFRASWNQLNMALLMTRAGSRTVINAFTRPGAVRHPSTTKGRKIPTVNTNCLGQLPLSARFAKTCSG